MQTVYFYVPFTKEELMKTVPLEKRNKVTPRTWDGKLGRGAQDLPDLLEQIEDYSNTAEKFKAPAKQKQAQIILAGDKEALQGLGENDTLYVMGHGGPGMDSLWSFDQDVENVTKLSAAEVVGRLEQDGLSQSIGKIKLISCNSADGSIDNPSFAEQFRRAQTSQRQDGRPTPWQSAEVSCYQGTIGLVDYADGSNRITKTSEMVQDKKTTTVRASLNAMTFNASNQLVNREAHRAANKV